MHSISRSIVSMLLIRRIHSYICCCRFNFHIHFESLVFLFFFVCKCACMWVSSFFLLYCCLCVAFFLQHHHLPSSCVFCCLCTVLKLCTYRFALRWNIIRFIYRFWSFTLHWDFCSIFLFNFGSQNTSIKPNCLVQSCYGWRVCFIYFWLWCCFFWHTHTPTHEHSLIQIKHWRSLLLMP